jgi:predicted RND superfamily exporter protein
LLTLLITAGLLYAVSRQCWMTFAPLLCSLAAVLWQIGFVTLLGYGIDLYSVFIPFLVLAIGVSHGVQMILSVGQLVAAGESPFAAARHSFHRLFAPGAIALVTAVMTFLAITTIKIPVIQELALTATIGVGALAFTNLLWLPLLLSYAKIGQDAVHRMRAGLIRRDRFWHVLAILVQPRYAMLLSLGAALVAAAAATAAQDLVVGDLQQGAAELRPNSRFNQDTVDLLSRFGNGADSLLVFAVSTDDSCLVKRKMDAIDEFVEAMRFVPGIHGTLALSSVMKTTNGFLNEGNIRWAIISHDHYVLGQSSGGGGGNRSLTDTECSVMPLYLYLDDHKAATLTGVIGAVRAYQADHPDLPIALELAGGNGGQAAATNDVVSAAQISMLGLVYLAVLIICGAAFRSVRAVICIIVPLALVSLIANGAMAVLGIGLKVSTLPVAALGVGIGVDYGIYKFSRLQHYMRRGMSLQDAYIQTLRETGSAVIFTGLTLSIGVVTWVFSPLQFQADMGLLLTLMFFANMIGAIFLLPALIGIMQIVKPERLTTIGEPPVPHLP